MSVNVDKSHIAKNFLSLFVYQLANYILPLITLPYLVRVLGPDKFGLIAFAQSFIQYFIILVDYGFNLSATREISINRDNIRKLASIFNSVMLIKIFLFILAFVIMSAIVLFFDRFKEEIFLYYVTFGIVLGQLLFPMWFFQGMEEMGYIAIFNILSKLIFTVSIFIFVHSVADYIYVPLLNSLISIFFGILSLLLVTRRFKIKLFIPPLSEIRYHFLEGGYIFVSRFTISFYTVSNVFVLGLFKDNTTVGIYSAAERLVNAIKSFSNVILQVMFPYVSRVYKKSKDEALKLVSVELKLFVGLGILLCSLIYVFSNNLLLFILGKKFAESVGVFNVLIFTIPVILASSIIGQQVLLNFGLKKLFTNSIVLVSFLHLLILPVMIYFLGSYGVAWSVFITESLILMFRLVGLYKLRKDIFYYILKG